MNDKELEREQPANDNMSQTDTQEANAAGNSGTESAETADIAASELETVKKEMEEYKDKYLRLVAEFDNFRRRNAKERVELIQTAGKDIVQSMLEVLDDSERAMKTMEMATDVSAVKEGVMLVFNKLKNTLVQKGLRPMECGSGSEFNPELHEAITEIPAPVEDLQGKIVDVLEKGYYLNDKLIRYAKVVVGK